MSSVEAIDYLYGEIEETPDLRLIVCEDAQFDDLSSVTDDYESDISVRGIAAITTSGQSETFNRDSLGIFLDDIGRVPLLTEEQEVKLGQALERGRRTQRRMAMQGKTTPTTTKDKMDILAADEAKECFVAANLRLVVSVAKGFRKKMPAGWELNDLVQEGVFGLYAAVEKFDWRMGNKFSTYATWRIRGAIARSINESSHSGLPEERYIALNAARSKKALDDPQIRTDDNLAFPFSLNQPAGLSEDIELQDVLSDGGMSIEEKVIGNEMVRQLLKGISTQKIGSAAAQLAVAARWGLLDGFSWKPSHVRELTNMPNSTLRDILKKQEKRLREIYTDTDSM